MKRWEFFPLTATRYAAVGAALFFGRQSGGQWRFVVQDGSGFAQVGPQYATKDELLSDIGRYAASWGMV